MYICLGITLLIYIWRIFQGTKRGLVGEVHFFTNLVIISVCAVLVAALIDAALEGKYLNATIYAFFLVLILIAHKIIAIAFSVLELLVKLPLLKGSDRFLGLLLGLIEATTLVWCLMEVATYLSFLPIGLWCISSIKETPVLNLIYEYRFQITYLCDLLVGENGLLHKILPESF